MFENKTVVIGIGGGIAAYKTAYLASRFAKIGADVHVIMTKNACNFINPITFETLTGNKCLVDTFDRNFEFNVEHVALAKRADVFIIAPATADVIAKTACGIADDMLTTTFLAAKCEKIVAPAMNTAMYENPVTQDNLDRLRSYGVRVLEPAEGYLACGDTGKGKMPEPEDLLAVLPGEYTGDLEAVKEELARIVGLAPVKDYVLRLEDNIAAQRRRAAAGMKTAGVTMHMIFTGNPGSGRSAAGSWWRSAGRIWWAGMWATPRR